MAATCPACGSAIRRNSNGVTAECMGCHKQFRIKDKEAEQRLPPPPPSRTVETYGVADDAKPCPYCGETIKSIAIKCRHCGEMLTSGQGLGVERAPTQRNPLYDTNVRESLIFQGSPSQWVNLAAYIFCGLLGLAGLVVIFVTIEHVPTGWVGFGLLSLSIIIAAAAYIAVEYTRYHVTTDRIELEKGWLSKQVDNLDLFRVKDVRVSQGIFDRIVGIGTVTVVSRDSTDPILKLAGICCPRELYDRLKKEAIRADRRRGVVHIES